MNCTFLVSAQLGQHGLTVVERVRVLFVVQHCVYSSQVTSSQTLSYISLHPFLNPDLKHSCTKVPTTNHSVTL